jgi:hypothetical protein
MLPFLAIAGAAAWFQPAIAGSDLYWHLAAGRDIWESGVVPDVDKFSYTFAGEVWMNHEWAWDALYWAIYRIRPQAVAWFNLAVVVAIFSAVFRTARQLSGSAVAAGAALWIAAACSHWYLDIRPHLFTLLFLQFLILTFERRWAPWSWPVLVVVWANVHGGFVFGFGAIGLWVVVRSVEASLREQRFVLLGKEWAWVALCLPAMLANPWGYEILAYPLSYLPLPGSEVSAYSSLVEWRATGLGLETLRFGGVAAWLASFQGGFWIAVVASVPGTILGLRKKPRALYLVALAGVTLVMALSARRFMPLFAVSAAPLIAIGFAAAIRWLRERGPALDNTGVRVLGAAVGCALVVFLWRDVRVHPGLLERWTQADMYPQAATRALSTLGPVRLFNYYGWGGYALLHAPEAKVFIDGRANTLYDDEIYTGYLRALTEPADGVRALLAKYPADVALVRAQGPLIDGLRAQVPPWRVVHRDSHAALLVAPTWEGGTQPLAEISAVVALEPQVLLQRARMRAVRGDVAGALRQSRQLVEENPLMLNAWAYHAQFTNQLEGPDAMREVIEEAVRVAPRREFQLRSVEGLLLADAGMKREALDAYRRGMRLDPFGKPEEEIARLEALEREFFGAESRPVVQ